MEDVYGSWKIEDVLPGAHVKITARKGKSGKRRTIPIEYTFVTWEDIRRQKFNPTGGPCITDSWLNQLRENGHRSHARIARPSCSRDVTIDWEFDAIPLMVGNQAKGNNGKLHQVTLTHYLQNLNRYTNLSVDGDFVIKGLDTHIAVSPQTSLLHSLDDEEVQFTPVVHHYQFDRKQPSQLIIVASANGTSCFVCDEQTKELPFNANGGAYNYAAERLASFRAHMHGTGAAKSSGPMSDFENYKNVLFVFMFELETTREEKIFFDTVPTDEDEVMRGMDDDHKHHQIYEPAIIGMGTYRGAFPDPKITIKRLSRASGRLALHRFQIGGVFTNSWTTASHEEAQKWSDGIFNGGGQVGSLVFDVDNRPTHVLMTAKERAAAQKLQVVLQAATSSAAAKCKLLLA